MQPFSAQLPKALAFQPFYRKSLKWVSLTNIQKAHFNVILKKAKLHVYKKIHIYRLTQVVLEVNNFSNFRVSCALSVRFYFINLCQALKP